jgi:molybdenum cofactor guanylyltransferase
MNGMPGYDPANPFNPSSMKLLGVILAGGQSRRFGSDKAQALFEGKLLLDHVADALRPQTDALLVAGRTWPDMESIADLPEPGLGPLGGLAGALAHAQALGFDAVLSSGCDLLGIPQDLAEQLGPGPAIMEDQPLLGLWPASLADILIGWLANPANRSVYRFADHIMARRMPLSLAIRNVNLPEDLTHPRVRTLAGKE